MPEAPVHKLNKKDILWLADHRCVHRHSYLSHYGCFLKEVADKYKWEPEKNIPIPHRIGFFHIEASGLKANFGIMLCYCIKDSESDTIYEYCISKKDFILVPKTRLLALSLTADTDHHNCLLVSLPCGCDLYFSFFRTGLAGPLPG